MDELQVLALEACLDIYNDYTEWEIINLSPTPAIISAWDIGKRISKGEQ
jgi:hypothetical protein